MGAKTSFQEQGSQGKSGSDFPNLNASDGGSATQRFAVHPMGDTTDPGTPAARGLYDPALDKDSCGVGFIADIK